jgi:hypothetical protein
MFGRGMAFLAHRPCADSMEFGSYADLFPTGSSIPITCYRQLTGSGTLKGRTHGKEAILQRSKARTPVMVKLAGVRHASFPC